jgi:hypothetical protein
MFLRLEEQLAFSHPIPSIEWQSFQVNLNIYASSLEAKINITVLETGAFTLNAVHGILDARWPHVITCRWNYATARLEDRVDTWFNMV